LSVFPGPALILEQKIDEVPSIIGGQGLESCSA
jgi:hypothetical protein